MGGLRVSFELNNKSEVLKALSSKAEFWTRWFSYMQPWSSSLVFKSRLAWLIIEGVPLKCGPQSPSQELGGCGVRDPDDISNSNSDMVRDDQSPKDDGGDTAE
ncbi:hypothetical protein Tco_0629290 [Tanacetum coccineum]|uniref:Uncharacterized protein n=1 Tax=Tanacetum coccineum TaxID=301880 RepID=A0ABQ4WSZ7_9ASTR